MYIPRPLHDRCNRPVLEALKKMQTVPMARELVHGLPCTFAPAPPPLPPTTTTAASATASATTATAAATATAGAAVSSGTASTAVGTTAVVNTVISSASVVSYLPHTVKLPQKLAKRGASLPVTVKPGQHCDTAAVLKDTVLDHSQVQHQHHELHFDKTTIICETITSVRAGVLQRSFYHACSC
jgi:hypothetical protein